jgi:hypothetical protein
VIVTITKKLEAFWATPEELEKMTQKEIIEMLREDTTALLDCASWHINREG